MMGCTSASLAVLAYADQLAVWQLALASFINGLVGPPTTRCAA